MYPNGNRPNLPMTPARNQGNFNTYNNSMADYVPTEMMPRFQLNQGPGNSNYVQQNRFQVADRKFTSPMLGTPSTSSGFTMDNQKMGVQNMQPNTQGIISQWQKEQQIAFRMINVSFDNGTESTGFLPPPAKKVALSTRKDTKLAIAAPSSGKTEKDEKMSSIENPVHQFVGSVEQVIRWYNAVRSCNIVAIFEVHGILESKFTKPDNTTVLMIKQNDGTAGIQGIYYAIDRPFVNTVRIGGNVVCVGKMKGAKKMQIYDAWPEIGEQVDYKRISSLCQRAIQHIVLSSSEP